MKKYIYICIQIIFFSFNANAQATLKGKVTDKKDGQPLIGAVVYIADLRSGVATDVDGNYELKGLPTRKFLVQVKFVGYSTISEQVDLSATTIKNFIMNSAVIEANEVVVTGSAFTSNNNRSSLSVVPLDRKELQAVGANNITDAIAQVPGVSGISTGSAISKPVIRGLGYNRIVTINEGLRQEGQQWGDEHGLEIDQFSADRIEVLKGPSSLLYGSDALGGVINILEPIPAPLGEVRGEFNSQYATNNGLTANSIMAEGNHSGFIWRGRATYKNASAYSSPYERIYNSGFNEKDGNLLLGINRPWGFSHLHASIYDANIGLVEGERDSATSQFLNFAGELVSNAEANTRKLDLPNQNIQHLKISSVNSFFIGKSNLRVTTGWQQNDRKEFSTSKSDPGLYFRLHTFSLDAKYYLPELKGIETVIGVSTLQQQNQNRGIEFLVPNYNMGDFGGFVSLKKNFQDVTLNAGLRYDQRIVSGDELIEGASVLFKDFKSHFSAITGSIGSTWQLSKSFNVKANIGRGFRAPNISELSANGIHEGTFRYEIGNSKLKPETSLQFDAGLGYESTRFSVDVSGFYNLINDFIYYRTTNNEQIIRDGINYPVYKYVQGNSLLTGFETTLDIHLIDQLHFENSLAYVYAVNNDTKKPLPFIPPLHFKSDLNYTFKSISNNRIKETHIKLILDIYSSQDRIDEFETKTEGATVLSVSTGTDFRIGKQWANLFLLCTNITNQNYYDHLSRLKDAGIHAMGRNVTLGVTIPFGLK